MSEFTTVAKLGEIPAGQGRAYRLGDRVIALFHVDGHYFAIDDDCPHMGAALHSGEVFDGAVLCDRHRWAFRLCDGVCLDAPTLRARTYRVRIVGEDIQVAEGEG